MSSSSSPPTTTSRLRELFPDKETVLVYPDDFPDDQKNIILSDLVNRNTGHFSDKRVAVLFRPRPNEPYHNINFPVGYWTQVLGLGETPEDVKFTGQLGIHAIPANTKNPGVGSLDTFWRSAENFVSDTSFVRNPENGVWSVPVGEASDLKPNEEKTGGEGEEEKEEKGGEFPNLYPLPGGFDNENNYQAEKGMLWAVSQAAPLRRVKVTNNLHLSLGNNYASGGFMSNVDVGGYLLFGTQQQFCIRNCELAEKAIGGAWSFVFNGCTYKKGNLQWVSSSNGMVSNEPRTSVRIEKPFIFIGNEDGNRVYLAIPKMKRNSIGTDYGKLSNDEKVVIDNKDLVKVIVPSDSFEFVQETIENGTHIILSPGIYHWDQTLTITNNNQVVLGIGMATIQAPLNGTKPCIRVANGISGVRISGISLEANEISDDTYVGSSLLEWGERSNNKKNEDAGNPNNPGAIHDLYCFVGGRNVSRDVKVEVMVRIYSGNVVGDNLWLWRADHVKLGKDEQPNRPELSEYHVTTYGECKCDTGLEVHGDNVLFHGLAVEHTYNDLLSWYGKNGSVYFYQSELPYDVSGEHFNDKVGYRVHTTGVGHSGYGIGVYSYFRDYDNVQIDSAIVHQANKGNYTNSFTVWLDGYGENAIHSVINGKGGATVKQGIPEEVENYSYNDVNVDVDVHDRHRGVTRTSLFLVTIISITFFLSIAIFFSFYGNSFFTKYIRKTSSSNEKEGGGNDMELVTIVQANDIIDINRNGSGIS